jgi:hypothetical protein
LITEVELTDPYLRIAAWIHGYAGIVDDLLLVGVPLQGAAGLATTLQALAELIVVAATVSHESAVLAA